MNNRHPHNADQNPPEKDKQPAGPHQCNCGCKPELVYAAELNQDYSRLLPDLCQFGETICFARNLHCILGAAICLPDMTGKSGYFKGGNTCIDLHWDTTQWRYAYTVHEQHKDRGLFVGLEFYDKNHRALCRTFLTPDSEHRDYQQRVQEFIYRQIPDEEVAGWYRMGDLTPHFQTASHAISEHFLKQDPSSAPIASWQKDLAINEQGFPNHACLAYALLWDAMEQGQELALTTAGAFGRLSLPFAPKVVERGMNGWMYAGAPNRALRLNLSATGSYWIGLCYDGYEFCSYLEALDVYGDLILRITSADTDTYQYWQSLATEM